MLSFAVLSVVVAPFVVNYYQLLFGIWLCHRHCIFRSDLSRTLLSHSAVLSVSQLLMQQPFHVPQLRCRQCAIMIGHAWQVIMSPHNHFGASQVQKGDLGLLSCRGPKPGNVVKAIGAEQQSTPSNVGEAMDAHYQVEGELGQPPLLASNYDVILVTCIGMPVWCILGLNCIAGCWMVTSSNGLNFHWCTSPLNTQSCG